MEKVAVKSRAIAVAVQKSDNKDLIAAAEKVPCILVINAAAPARSKHMAGPFYPDQTEELTSLLRGLRVRESFIVALDAESRVNLCRRPRK